MIEREAPFENIGELKDILYFGTAMGQRDVYEACKSAGDYIVAEDISAVALIDRSARAMWPGLRAYLKQQDPTNKPDIFFVDNQGFKNAGSDEQLVDKFETEHPFFLKHKDKRVLLLDTCIHEARASKPIISALQEVGFSDVRFGVVSDRNNRSDIQPDLVLLDRIPSRSCYPFGESNLTEHNKRSLHSQPVDNLPQVLPAAKHVRRRIAEIVSSDGEFFDDIEVIDEAMSRLLGPVGVYAIIPNLPRRHSVKDRVGYTLLGTYFSTLGAELGAEIGSNSHAPLIPVLVGGLALNAGLQTWLHAKSP